MPLFKAKQLGIHTQKKPFILFGSLLIHDLCKYLHVTLIALFGPLSIAVF